MSSPFISTLAFGACCASVYGAVLYATSRSAAPSREPRGFPTYHDYLEHYYPGWNEQRLRDPRVRSLLPVEAYYGKTIAEGRRAFREMHDDE